MADGLEITTTGFAEVERSLEEMGQSLGEQICRKALRAGGNVMKAAIAANAPVRPPLPSGTALPPGALQSDITVIVSKDAPDSFSAWIEPGKETIHVARWVEWGHRLVRGKTRKRKNLKGKEIGDVVAHPYIRPAFDANEDLAFEAIAETVATEVNKVASERGLNAGR
jgi:HK97 gp10 family phage protein